MSDKLLCPLISVTCCQNHPGVKYYPEGKEYRPENELVSILVISFNTKY